MDDYTANAPGLWLAQNDPSLNERAMDPSLSPHQAQEAGASDQYSETTGGDYENGVIPTSGPAPSGEAADPSQGAVAPDTGVSASGPSPQDQPMVDGATTPPPPSYGGEAGAPPPGADAGYSDPGTNPQDSAFPAGFPGDSSGSSQPGNDSQMAATGIPEGLSNSVEPPLGLLPIIVFGLATIMGLVIYLSRRGKNWSEISDSMRDDGGGVSHPESRIVTQFSDIHDMKNTRHTQNSVQVSGFE